MRNVETEETKVRTGKSGALRSKKSLFYHDIPPELFKRAALRHTVGHKKYNQSSCVETFSNHAYLHGSTPADEASDYSLAEGVSRNVPAVVRRHNSKREAVHRHEEGSVNV
jgi:hypothetical protein